ncbi:MAG: hypothetical protein H6669_20465 [Ardenticatenaceae bacterium]|nr:hypothetical protein [Ardenticatenaceae bacterium]
MKRIVTLFVFLFLGLLASCGAAQPNTAVTTQDDPASPAASQSGDTAVAATSFTPAQNVDEAIRLRSDDHTHGAAEPIVTIIEYGDFQ